MGEILLRKRAIASAEGISPYPNMQRALSSRSVAFLVSLKHAVFLKGTRKPRSGLCDVRRLVNLPLANAEARQGWEASINRCYGGGAGRPRVEFR